MQVPVRVGSPGNRFTLIPDGAAKCEWNERIDLAIEDNIRIVVTGVTGISTFIGGDLGRKSAGNKIRSRDKGLHAGAARGGVYQTYGNFIQVIVQFPAEKIGCRGKFRGIRGVAYHPTPRICCLRRFTKSPVDVARTDERVIGGGYFHGGVVHCASRITALHGVTHIGLARAQPDFTDIHIANGNRVGPGYGQCIRAPGVHTRQFHHPVEVGAGCGGCLLSVDTDGDFFVGGAFSPNGNRHSLLKHHTVAEKTLNGDIRGNHARK